MWGRVLFHLVDSEPDYGELFIGCAGFQYDDWIGTVYPPGTKKSEMLELYAHYFSFLELNFTYYRMPTAETIGRIAERAPDLCFAVKAHQSMTHSRDADCGAFASFEAALEPLLETGQLLVCLLQFPHSFYFGPPALRWLETLRVGLPALPLVAEFRSREWIRKEVPFHLRDLGISWCAVDEPDLPGLMPPLAAVTGPTGYVRFHGRNAAQWYDHEQAWQRYDYRYTAEELADWLPRLERLLRETDQTIVVMNNHYRGQAVENGQMLRDLLPPAMREVLHAPEELLPRVDSRAGRTVTPPDQ